MTTIAYGLDLAGYSTDGSAFAKVVRRDGDSASVTLFSQHCFGVKRNGWRLLDGIVYQEVALINKCLAEGSLDVDVPIDLQGLPFRQGGRFVWELTKRAVDFAFGAMPPLADRIGSYVARFSNILGRLPDDALGHRLFETYPAASLELMSLPNEKYKGEAEYVANEWVGVGSKNEAESKRNGVMARILNELQWTANPHARLGHDGFDAILCALTGLAPSSDRLEGDALGDEICRRLKQSAGQAISEFPSVPPRGYRLLAKQPKRIHVDFSEFKD